MFFSKNDTVEFYQPMCFVEGQRKYKFNQRGVPQILNHTNDAKN